MKLTTKQVRKIIQEEMSAISQAVPSKKKSADLMKSGGHLPYSDQVAEDERQDRRKLSKTLVGLINKYGREGAKELVDTAFSQAVGAAKMSSF